jgi:hypothetical protein
VRGLPCAAMACAFSSVRRLGDKLWEGVAADLDLHAELYGPALDHAPGIDPVHGRGRERAGARDGRAVQGTLFTAGDAGGTEVFIEEGFELAVRWHFVALAAFFVKADHQRLPLAK